MKRSKKRAMRFELSKSASFDLMTNMNTVVRNRMDAIIEMTKLALATNLNEEQRGYLETVRRSADSLVGFLNDIVDSFNIENHQFELEEIDFNLRSVLEHADEMLAEDVVMEGAKLNWHTKVDVPMALSGDPGRLCQVIVNLTRNVIKFARDGELNIRLETQKKEETSVVLHIVISAMGVGISPEEMGFESIGPMHNTNTREYSSRVLGLNLSKHLVEMMGGRLWLETEPGKGSTLHFTARLGLSQPKIKEAPDLRELDLSGVPVLIVDDNEINRLVFRNMICSRGLVPAEAANGKEAIKKAKQGFDAGKPYRLILLDLQMPGMDGFDVARKIKESPLGVQADIILLTSVGKKGDTATCREVGISGYLLKPVEKSELLDAISIALGSPAAKTMPVITRYTIQEARRKREDPLTVTE